MVEQMRRNRREFRDSKPGWFVQRIWRAFSVGEVVMAGSRVAAIIYVGYLLLSGGALF
jgi:hypothetical protein